MKSKQESAQAAKHPLSELYKSAGFFETLGVVPKLKEYVPPGRPNHFTAALLREPCEKEGKKMYKYEVNVPLSTPINQLVKTRGLQDKPLNEVLNLDMNAVTLTVWSEKEIAFKDGDISSLTNILDSKEPKTLTTLFASGFLADSEQLDRRNSYVEKLAAKYHEKKPGKEFNNVIIGVSCPGFTGSETDHTPDKDSIGVQAYAHLLKALLITLHPHNTMHSYGKTQLIGHSAGGAATLLLVHELNKLEDAADPYMSAILQQVYNLAVLPSALHPAINSSIAKQFILMRDLNQIKYMLHLEKLSQDEITRIVVRIALGLPPFAKPKHAHHSQKYLDQEDQVTKHCLEFANHLHAGYAKLDDLKLPQTHGENTGKGTQILSGFADRITPLLQILQGFELIDASVKEVTKEMIDAAKSILDVVNTGHDDFCFDEKTADYYADYIASNTANRLL